MAGIVAGQWVTMGMVLSVPFIVLGAWLFYNGRREHSQKRDKGNMNTQSGQNGAVIILGTGQDEGKGKLVDWMCQRADAVVVSRRA